MARFPADYDYDPVDSDEECASAAATQHTGCVRFSSLFFTGSEACPPCRAPPRRDGARGAER